MRTMRLPVVILALSLMDLAAARAWCKAIIHRPSTGSDPLNGSMSATPASA